MEVILLLLVTVLLEPISASPATDPTSFWALYDSCASTSCLVPITKSFPCETDDNSCVCTTTSFVAQVATCLGQKCPLAAANTYFTYESNCQSNGGYKLALTKTQFLATSGTLISFLEAQFWNGYPDCANSGCLSPLTASSGCEIDDNSCVCQNATLITQMAECVGTACSSSTTAEVYSTYSSACASNGGYSIALSSAQWQSAAGSGTGSGNGSDTSAGSLGPSSVVLVATPSSSKTTILETSASMTIPLTSLVATPPPTSTQTSQLASPTATVASNKPGGGFTEDQKIAIGVGLGTGLPAVILAAVGLFWRRHH